MRTKGAANKVRFGKVQCDVLDDLVKFRCSNSFKKLLQDFRNCQPGYIARQSEGSFVRKAILQTMLRDGHIKPDLLERIQQELEKV